MRPHRSLLACVILTLLVTSCLRIADNKIELANPRCGDQAACAANELCRATGGMEGELSCVPACNDDSHCGEGFECGAGGACQAIDDVMVVDDDMMVDSNCGSQPPCADDELCVAAGMLEELSCVPACEDDAQCDEGVECGEGGFCLVPPPICIREEEDGTECISAGCLDPTITGTQLCNDGVTPRDCQTIKALLPQSGSGVYRIDPHGPEVGRVFSARCDMETDGGGWTMVVSLQRDMPMWDAWEEIANIQDSDGHILRTTTGLGMKYFSDTEDGEDLEFMFVVDGVIRDVVYRGVNKQAWNPSMGDEVFDDTFESRAPGESEWQHCDGDLQHVDSLWNWSIAQADTPRGCNGTQWSGRGFLIQGEPETPEMSNRLSGLDDFSDHNRWLSVNIYTRRTQR